MMEKKSRRVASSRAAQPKYKIDRLLNRAIREFPIPVIIHDEDGHIVQISKGWTQFSGYTLKDIRTVDDWTERAYGASKETVKEYIGHLFENRQPNGNGDWVIRAKDGSKRIWHFITTPLGISRGRRLMLAIAVDVTERRQVEEALSKTEELLKQGVRVAGVGIFDHDQIDDTIHWSVEMKAICGWAPEEPVTLPAFIERVHPEDRETIAQAIGRAHDPTGEGLYDVEHRLLLPDATVRWVRTKAQTFFRGKGSSRHPVRTVGALVDITEQKEAEAYRERMLVREQELRAEAESANRLKDEFLSMLSHELRTPLTAILGWCYVLRQKQVKSDVAQAVETIERNARAQERLVEDILDVSRIASRNLVLAARAVDFRPIIESAIDSVRPAVESKGIRLQSSLDVSPHLVFGDADRLLQVAWNVLSNAVKFTPRGGIIDVTLQRRVSQLSFVVSDTGEGIDPAFLAHVFDPFRQADSTNTRRYGGLGLGLAITRQILEMHGGSIRAESAGKGKGATFAVDLPLYCPLDARKSA
jgi:PAS domain S-box-containing protein